MAEALVSDGKAVLALKAACDAAYEAAKGSCSTAVWHALTALGVVKGDQPNANGMMDMMARDWKEVTVDEGHKLANQGIAVVGGKKETGHGHVILIYPGDKKFNGGYSYEYKGKMITLPGKTLYPRAMSTSISGRWPGTMSKGDKTVWDPWANDEKFALVKFYTPKTA
jgi:hypothetical protein